MQLWFEGQLHYLPTQVDGASSCMEDYGIDWEGPCGSSEIGINLPQIDVENLNEITRFLESNINPLADSADFGIDIYVDSIAAVTDFINSL